MNIDSVINDIENITDIADRCVAYSEVIIHLQTVRNYMAFRPETPEWKNHINTMITDNSIAYIDVQIDKIKNMVRLNVEVTKLI